MLKVLLWLSLAVCWASADVLRFQPEVDVVDEMANAACPQDPKFICPNNQTCCKGRPPNPIACCPYIKGECCPDGMHCCPRGSHCDMFHKRCYRQVENKIEIFEAVKQEKAMLFESKKLESVICPGGGSQCPDGNTCCLMQSGDYGCCPLPQAVCCSDQEHCCPSHYVCDVAGGKCKRGGDVLPLFKKFPAKAVELEQGEKLYSVKCLDGHSKCPDGNTCCKLPGGTFGCCPRPEAVCCSDGVHCCPKGYKCDPSGGTCQRGSRVIPFLRKLSASKIEPVENVVCPDGQSECPSGNTCCKLSSGAYGCCPIPKAVCCSDGVHCCPNGYKCDVSAGTCSKGLEVIPFLRKSPAKELKPTPVEDVVCPGGQSECPSGSTCCKLSSGGYGCCPMPKAVCCSDGVHCCPNGYKCDVGAGTCAKGLEVIPFLRKSPAKELKPTPVEDVVCPGGQSECPSGSTCCKLSSGGYGCCPMPKAVCCSDGVHCCPNGYKCDVGAGTCAKGAEVIPFLRKSPAKELKPTPVEDVVCPGGQSECPSGSTCCKLSSGGYGCCPMPKAVCCSDGVHCCPNGYKCDVGAGTCAKGAEVIPFLRKSPAKELKPTPVEDVVCPGGQSECPSGSTCCKLSSGGYGCCPMPKAVCCSDGVHCCPNGYKCDVGAGTCAKGAEVIPFLRKSPAKELKPTPVEDVVCPGGQSECPSGSTCCKLSSGGYGCCPMPKAVCCSDGVHCCPNGYKCDVGAGTCAKGAEVIPFLRKSPAKELKPTPVEDVVCPGGQSECPSGSTCCKLSSGGYGCCPMPKAVCCSDGVHCCPNGYKCDVGAGTCAKGAEVIPFLRKSPAKELKPTPVEDVVCPGGQSECPSGSTCCKLSSGGYGCCPMPKAVCCSDGVHCCPNGYKCDVGAGTCAKGAEVIPFLRKSPAKELKPTPVEDVVCPGGQSECPSGSTCCKLSSGGYGCCPMPKAVCCSDGVHCCPNGYKCDVGAGTCAKGAEVIPFLRKSPAKELKPTPVEDVVCPGGQSECPSGSTCCKLSSGGYGCCPMPKAVCCSDGVHCCPNGYKCDVGAGTCAKGLEVIPFLRKSPAKELKPTPVEDVVCPGGQSECPSGSTCCKLSSGGYGCCPMPKAVCCSDGVHCCPNGYKCDVGAGTCAKGLEVIPFLRKSPAKELKPTPVEDVVCPGGQSECPSGSTCCKLSSGGYGCCPMPKAVCCSDGVHCCPNGYKCDVGAGTCAKGLEVIPFLRKSPAKELKPTPVEDVVCPGGQSECPSGSTCCKLSSGGYGCCPMPKAVCCSDGVHCCPNGYKCDVGAGTCAKGLEVIPFLRKSPAKELKPTPVEDVVCPGGQSECPSGSTCCKLSSGGYGCCPMPKAVCCSDGVHCCPNGYTCDVGAGTCAKGLEVIPFLRKSPAKELKPTPVEDVVCPGGQSECPSGSTCCKLSSGGYGCCPIPKAVCCSDGVHCCPNGYTCDVAAGTCMKGSEVVPFLSKFPASPSRSQIAKKVESVVCPSGTSMCADGETCCPQPGGGYGCCPIPQAVCCSDKQHCCPNGYRCNLAGGSCIKGLDILPLFVKKPAYSLSEMKQINN